MSSKYNVDEIKNKQNFEDKNIKVINIYIFFILYTMFYDIPIWMNVIVIFLNE